MDLRTILFICVEMFLFLIILFFLRKRSFIKKSKYFCTKEFYIKNLVRKERKYGKYFYYKTIVAIDETFEEVFKVNKKTFNKLKKGQQIGKRDIYTLKGYEKFFKTFKEGETPVLNGKEELKMIFNLLGLTIIIAILFVI